MTLRVSRRQFFKLGAAGMATSSMAMMGFAPDPAIASIRHFKLTGAKITRSNCTYCSVGCGVLNNIDDIYHVEGDPDHPVSRGSLCPKGAGLLDYIRSESRLRYPQVREAGSREWKRISWDEAFTRIARYMKDDRDANFITENEEGQTVNRWTTTGMLAASASTNETAYCTHRIARSLGMVVFDNQARV